MGSICDESIPLVVTDPISSTFMEFHPVVSDIASTAGKLRRFVSEESNRMEQVRMDAFVEQLQTKSGADETTDAR